MDLRQQEAALRLGNLPLGSLAAEWGCLAASWRQLAPAIEMAQALASAKTSSTASSGKARVPLARERSALAGRLMSLTVGRTACCLPRSVLGPGTSKRESKMIAAVVCHFEVSPILTKTGIDDRVLGSRKRAVSSGFQRLRGKDSNLDYLIQSQASYR